MAENDKNVVDEMKIKVVDMFPTGSLGITFTVSATLPDPDYDPDEFRPAHVNEGWQEFAFLIAGNLYEEALGEWIELKPEFQKKLQQARRMFDDPTIKPFFVSESLIWGEGDRGLGIGTKLYIEAVKYAARHNAILFPHTCQKGGTLNEASDRVWKGRTFRSKINILDEYMASAIQLV